MSNNRTNKMGEINDQIDDIRALFYTVLDFEENDYSEKKSLAKREVLNAINELRIQTENL